MDILILVAQILGGIVIVLLAILIVMLCPPIRTKLKEISLYNIEKKFARRYERRLHLLVLIRQLLLFLAPWAIVSIIDFSVASKHLPSWILVGLSLTVFVSIQLPLLMKAHIHVNFMVNETVYHSAIPFKLREHEEDSILVEARIYNLGFSTYKNSVAIFYFKEDFEILPCNHKKYRHLDEHFKKEFSIQKIHGGVLFSPKDNFLSIPPQEVFIFPMFIKAPKVLKEPKKEKERKMEIEFYSENTWGKTVIEKQVILRK